VIEGRRAQSAINLLDRPYGSASYRNSTPWRCSGCAVRDVEQALQLPRWRARLHSLRVASAGRYATPGATWPSWGPPACTRTRLSSGSHGEAVSAGRCVLEACLMEHWAELCVAFGKVGRRACMCQGGALGCVAYRCFCAVAVWCRNRPRCFGVL
jgi:hypothetical protein